MVILPVGHMGGFEVKNNIALTVTVCIASFKVIGELQREKLRRHFLEFKVRFWDLVFNP